MVTTPEAGPVWTGPADPDLVAEATVAGVRDIMNASDALRNACARHYGLAQSDILAVSHIAAFGSMTPSELAERLHLTGATVTSVADRLEKAGMARRVPHGTDRRRVVLEVTETGLAHITATRVLITRAMAGMTDPEQVAAVLAETASRLQAQIPHVGELLDGLAPGAAP